MFKRFLKNTTVKNAGWLIFGKVAQMIISLVVSMLTARYLGPSNYGLINYAGAYTAFFMAFCTLGINSILVKEFIDTPEDEGKIIGSTLVLKGISSILSAILIICFVCVLEADEPTTIAVTALSSISVVFNIFETFNYWFQSKLKSKVTAIVTLVAYFATSLYRVVLLILGKSVKWFALATTIDYVIIGILLVLCYWHYGGKKLAFSKSVSKHLLNKSVHFIFSGLMVSVYRYSDKFMLKQMCGESEVGFYSTAAVLSTMWCFVLSAIIDSVYPSIMSEYQKSKEFFEKRNRQLYAIVFYLCAIVSVLLCVFGEFVIKLLYGEDYLSAVVPLQVLTWHTGFSYLGVARNAWIVCENKGKYLKYIYLIAVIGNLIMNYLLIPILGATGAALASLLTQILTTFVLPLCIKDLRRNAVIMLEAICFRKLK